MSKQFVKTWTGRLGGVLIVGNLLIFLLSWLLTATVSENVNSLLTSEGIRWFFNHFSDGVARPVLAWILQLAIAFGCCRDSGLLTQCDHRRRKYGLRIALMLLVVYVAVILLLTVVPHAVLLSSLGTLDRSPFSRAIVMIVCICVVLCSVGYGAAVRTFQSFDDVVGSWLRGLRDASPFILLYMLIIQLYDSVCFVFMQNH